MPYDVFISHRSDDRPWVRTLGTNLKSNGLTVFLDEWELVPGDSFVEGLERGLEDSKKGILVCTPSALESGWVRHEYDRMIARRASADDAFRLVPIVLDPNAPKHAFLKSIQHVDFSRRERYRESFERLLCGLKGNPPGDVPWFDGPLKIPGYSRYDTSTTDSVSRPDRAWVDHVFETLFSRQAVVMPAPQDRLDGQQKALILRKAVGEFGSDRAEHLMPPSGGGNRLTKAERQEYFRILARQCGLEGKIVSGRELREALADRLEQGALLVLISSFDHGHPDAVVELATNLRMLLETQPQFKVVLTGGEDLADLFFLRAEHSLMDLAEYLPCPEMSHADVRAMLERDFPSVRIGDEIVDQVRATSGGLPRLVTRCARYVTEAEFDEQSARREVACSPEVWKKILPLVQEARNRQCLGRLLQSDDVGPWQPYLTDALHRRLYWAGLLRRSDDGRRLIWRCPGICDVARGILAS